MTPQDDADVTDPEENTEPEPKPKPSTANVQKTDWETSYKTLQRKYDKLQNKLSEMEEKYEAAIEQLEDLKQDSRKSTDSAKSLQDQLDKKDAEIARLQKEAQSVERKIGRSKLILSEFSDLADFEGEGLLPDADNDEDLRAKLTKFRENLNSRVGDGVSKKIKGAGPSTHRLKEEPELDIDAVYDEMVRYAGSTDPEGQRKYQDYAAQWRELRLKQQ